MNRPTLRINWEKNNVLPKRYPIPKPRPRETKPDLRKPPPS